MCERIIGNSAPEHGRGLLFSRHGWCETSNQTCINQSFPATSVTAASKSLLLDQGSGMLFQEIPDPLAMQHPPTVAADEVRGTTSRHEIEGQHPPTADEVWGTTSPREIEGPVLAKLEQLVSAKFEDQSAQLESRLEATWPLARANGKYSYLPTLTRAGAACGHTPRRSA